MRVYRATVPSATQTGMRGFGLLQRNVLLNAGSATLCRGKNCTQLCERQPHSASAGRDSTSFSTATASLL